jgi:hypothetical protein
MTLNTLLRRKYGKKMEADFLITIYIFLPGGSTCRYEFIRVQDDYLCVVVKKKPVLRDIENKIFEKIFKSLSSVKIISIPKKYQVSLSKAVTYTVTIERGENSIQFHWYDKCPKEWRHVSNVVKKFIDLAENA